MLNSARKYCYAKAADPRYANYYSLRKLTAVQRDAVVATHAFYREIEDVIFECQDLNLAMTKFNWWRAEVVDMTSAHPVLVLLRATVPHHDFLGEKLGAIIDGVEQNLALDGFATFSDVVVHFMRTAGERELLLQKILGQEEIIPRETLYQLMLIIEMVNYLQHLHRYVQRGYIFFPADELVQFQVTVKMLQAFKTTPAICKLLQHQAEKVMQAYAQVAKQLTRQQQQQLSHLWVRCEIARATLSEIQASDFTVLENYIGLTPLRYSWIAWWS